MSQVELLDTHNTANQPQSIGSKTMSMFGFGNYGNVAPNTRDYTIDESTAIAEIESDLPSFLEHDLKSEAPLQSSLLIYAVKELCENDSSRYDEIMATPGIKRIMDHRQHMKEALDARVENLECVKTKDYIFLIPKDQWDKKRTVLPKPCKDGRFLTPNLTAILRRPVYYNYSEETDGEVLEIAGKEEELVYDEHWVGKEIAHFTSSKQLFEAEALIQEKLGEDYHIPESWEEVLNIAREMRDAAKSRGNMAFVADILVEMGFTRDGTMQHGHLVNMPPTMGCYQTSVAGRCLVIGTIVGQNRYKISSNGCVRLFFGK